MPEGVCLNKLKFGGSLILLVKPIIQLHVTLFSRLHKSRASHALMGSAQ